MLTAVDGAREGSSLEWPELKGGVSRKRHFHSGLR